MEAMDIQAVESKLSDVTVTAIPMINKQISNQQQQQQHHHRHHHHNHQQQQLQHHHNMNNNHHHHQQQQQHHHQPQQQQHQQQSLLSPNAIPSHISLQKTTVLGPLTITPTSSLPSPMASFSVQSPLSLISSQHSPPPLTITTRVSSDITTPLTSLSNIHLSGVTSLTKYAQLLSVIEEMGRDIRPTYSGSRSSAERLKRGIVHARILVRECLMETERSAKQ